MTFAIMAFFLFPFYALGKLLGMVFEAFRFGFGNGRKRFDEE